MNATRQKVNWNRDLFDKIVSMGPGGVEVAEKAWPLSACALATLGLAVETLPEDKAISAEQGLAFIGQFLLRKKSLELSSHDGSLPPEDWFKWADEEKGKKMWRSKREAISRVFSGFTLKGTVRSQDVSRVLAAVDEAIGTDGYFSSLANCEGGDSSKQGRISLSGHCHPMATMDFDAFEKFVFGLGLSGKKLKESLEAGLVKQKVELAASAVADAEEEATGATEPATAQPSSSVQLSDAEVVPRIPVEVRPSSQLAVPSIHPQVVQTTRECLIVVQGDPSLKKIYVDSFILTGYAKDAGPNELRVSGPHVIKLKHLLESFGFSIRANFSEEEELKSVFGNRWSAALVRCWAAVQRTLGCRLCDGVPDKESVGGLLKLLTQEPPGQDSQDEDPDSGFRTFLSKLHSDWAAWVRTPEGQTDTDFSLPPGIAIVLKPVKLSGEDVSSATPSVRVEEEYADSSVQGSAVNTDSQSATTSRLLTPSASSMRVSLGKPTIKNLSKRLGMSMLRIEWLHSQFASLVDGGVDDYPENPSALSKDLMRELIKELQPQITEDQFAAKFAQIDSDGSGLIEFDEFLQWIADDDVEISENP
jgi:hypothetical protein